MTTGQVSNQISSSNLTFSPNWNTSIGSGVYSLGDTVFVAEDGLRLFAKYVLCTKTEEELKDILDSIKIALDNEINAENSTTFTDILEAIFKERHFSEEFLLNYIDKFEQSKLKKILYPQHKADILSGKYSALALRILLDD